MRWPLQPLQPFQQTQLQPPFGQSLDSLCHPWFTTTNVSYRFPILKLPPPPCAVLLVIKIVKNRSSLTGGSCPRSRSTCATGQVNEIIRKYRMLTGPGTAAQFETCSCCFTVCVPEMNRDWPNQWSAREYAKQRNLFTSGPSISGGCFVKKGLSFRCRFRYCSKRENEFLGNGHEPKKIQKTICCHRDWLHERTKIQNAHPEGLGDGETKKHPKSS